MPVAAVYGGYKSAPSHLRRNAQARRLGLVTRDAGRAEEAGLIAMVLTPRQWLVLGVGGLKLAPRIVAAIPIIWPLLAPIIRDVMELLKDADIDMSALTKPPADAVPIHEVVRKAKAGELRPEEKALFDRIGHE